VLVCNDNPANVTGNIQTALESAQVVAGGSGTINTGQQTVPLKGAGTLPTNTPTDTPTNTPTNTPTDTPTSTPTNTPSPTATNTPTPTPSIGAFTPGYWKNHLANSSSKGPFYSSECNPISKFGGSCSNNGPWAIQYLPQTLGTYQVKSITTAAQIFKAMNCGSSKDAIDCLADHQAEPGEWLAPVRRHSAGCFERRCLPEGPDRQWGPGDQLHRAVGKVQPDLCPAQLRDQPEEAARHVQQQPKLPVVCGSRISTNNQGDELPSSP
jgi:hypothetical protein